MEVASENAGAVGRKAYVWSSHAVEKQHDNIAQEVAVALVYNGISHAVMMTSPIELEAFALGFSLTEGIISHSEDIYAIDIIAQDKGIEVSLTISSQCFMQLKTRRRNLIGRTGCGICGAESLEQVRPVLKVLDSNFTVSHDAINRATENLSKHQPLQVLTGAFHGAAWCDAEGIILHVCEDVGRHNALDKLIGSLWLSSKQQRAMKKPDALKLPGFLVISSRASYEIVQKSAKAGIAMVVAVSAPTSLAVDIAKETGITLIGFSRKQRHIAYTHIHRVIE
jgi:formate dehydrogenase accessory protein FdhD